MSCVPFQESVQMNNNLEITGEMTDAEPLEKSTAKEQELYQQSTSSNSSDSDESEVVSPVDDIFEPESCFIHPLLERDIHLFEQFFPMETITYRVLDDLCEVDIEMTINLGLTQKSVIAAWGLCEELPLTLKLNMRSLYYYYEKGVDKMEIFQGLTKKRTVVLLQLKNIADTFSGEYFLSKSQSQKEPADDHASEKQSSDETKGYLVKLYSRIQERLQTLNDHCPICDKLHGATSMLKPTVCSHPLCIFSSQTIGVMCQVTEALHTQPEVLNLLIAFTHMASFSSRLRDVLQPFPDFMESDSQEFIFSKEGDGLILLRKVMIFLYNFNFSGTHSEANLKELLNLQQKHSYTLLRWIISSNRSHILYIPIEKQIPFMQTKYQFVLRNSPPAEDERFRALAELHGSCFAFHGSPLENWHAIIRQGLVIASGTDLQVHGAVFGRGIYVTPSLGVALAYTSHQVLGIQMKKPHTTATKTKDYDFDVPHMCVALCEVITGPKLKKKSPMRWIVEDSQYICTRFFFVYGQMKPIDVDSASPEFQDSIKCILSDI